MKTLFYFTRLFTLTFFFAACADEGNPAGQSSDGARERAAHRNRGHGTDGVYSKDVKDSSRYRDYPEDTAEHRSGKGSDEKQGVPGRTDNIK